MKKIILMMMTLFSITIFGNSVKTIKVTEKIKFGITPKELYEVVKSEPLSNSHDNGSYAVYYYSNVEDPIGIKRQFNSFAFSENKLFSIVFDSQTTDEEHLKIVESYKKNAKKLKMEVEVSGSGVRLYDKTKQIKVYRMLDHTFINVSLI